MHIENLLKERIKITLGNLYNIQTEINTIALSPTPKNFKGNYSLTVFPYLKNSGKNPEETAIQIGQYLKDNFEEIIDFNAVKGYCNLEISDTLWIDLLENVLEDDNFGYSLKKNKTVVVEYASPNTNKPLHLGHIRNILLGYSTSEILKAAGYEVKKVQIVNDRGIHICKSMLAWQKWGNGQTPQSSGLKGDHLVGKYYVLFEKNFKQEFEDWKKSDAGIKLLAEEKLKADKRKFLNKKTLDSIKDPFEKDKATEIMFEEGFEKYINGDFSKTIYFNNFSQLGSEAKEMLQNWEKGTSDVISLWKMMNGWVYEGFDKTYENLGVNFDKLYYESDTYLNGKDLVERNLLSREPIFYKKEDGSVWIDLKDVNLDEKVVLRNDGTSMYITQDLGTAERRFSDYNMDKMVYVVGNEQDYHFKVLFEILKRLGYHFAKNCFHLSYGMVELPEGKMKSREGKVVDADDLIEELIRDVQQSSEERATLEGLSELEKSKFQRAVALGALKFYILKVEPKKGMVFDPKQSIDLQGHTGPYIQNAYVRTQSVQRVFAQKNIDTHSIEIKNYQLQEIEKELLLQLQQLPAVIEKAADEYSPAELANYLYLLGKTYHQFWNIVKILDDNNLKASVFRLKLSTAVAKILKTAGKLLGMEMPERM